MSWPLCNLCPGHSCYLCLGTAQEPRPTSYVADAALLIDSDNIVT